MACAPQRGAGSPGAGIVQQEYRPATAASGTERSASSDEAQPDAAKGQQSSDKTLVIGLTAEVRGFSLMNDLQNKYVEDFVHGNLFLQDEQGRWFPVLAAESPSVEAGTWKLHADGTSQVTYRIRKGVKWHDGAEFTVHDLVLWWRVARDREIPYQAGTGPAAITNMEPVDDYTLETSWNRWDPEADTIDIRKMWPMPRHLLEEAYNTDKQRFINHPFWTSEFVGLGPYRVARLVPGSHLELTANQEYVLGAPKIRNIVIRFYGDANVLMSALLAGEAHMTLQGTVGEGALSMADGILVGTRWSGSREGKVVFHPYRMSILAVQFNPEFQRPAALGDVRVRQALLHAMDRQGLIDSQFGGFTDVAHSWLSPRDPDHDLIADAVTRYDYDLARAQRLLSEAGWQRGSDGVLGNASGERFELEYRAAGRDHQTAATIVADHWKRVGLDVQLAFVPAARLKDNEYMAKFPGIRAHVMVAAPVGGASGRYTCQNVARAENNWLRHDTNPAGYCNPAMERHFVAFESAFPFTARMEPFKEMMRLALQDLPYLPVYYESEPIAVRANVHGVNRVPPKDRGRIGMHAYIWTID
jgi:peptide/nickel transport system substrate-binding protein